MASGTHEQLRQIGRDTMLTYARHGLGLVIGMAVSVLLARGLGRQGIGILTLAVLLPGMISTFLSFGIPTAGVFFLGRGEHTLREVFHAQLAAAMVQSLAGVAVGVAVIYWLRETLFADVPVALLWLSLAMIPVLMTRNSLVAMFQGLREFRQFNLVLLFMQVVQLAAVLVLVWGLQRGPTGALLANLAAETATLALCLVLLGRRCGFSWRELFHPHRLPYLRQGAGFGLPSYLAQTFNFFNRKADRFLLNSFLAPGQVGIYKIGSTIAERLWLLPQTMSTILMPHIAALRHLDDDRQKRELTPIIVRHVLWASLGCGTVIFILAHPLILLLYGAPFVNAARVLQVIMPGVVCGVVGVVLRSDIAGRGRPGLNVVSCALALAVNLTANVILIPRYAMTGAAFASTLSYTVDSVLVLGIYWRLAGVPPWRLVLPQLAVDVPVWRSLAAKVAARIKRHRGA